MPPLRLDRFQRVSERDRWGLGECVDALDTQRRNAPVVLKRLPPVTAEQRGRVEAVVRVREVGAEGVSLRVARTVAGPGGAYSLLLPADTATSR